MRTVIEIGIEHEYIVRRAGKQVDFRVVVAALGLPGGGLDPGDRFAHRMPIGTVITCDGMEAEVSIPPIPVQPGVAVAIEAWTGAASDQLVSSIPAADLEGCSTHISVTAPDSVADAAAGVFSRTFAPAVMLLMERRDSFGLLVRPRAGRIEVGGDFTTGRSLAAAALMAAGGVRASVAVAQGTRRLSTLAPPIAVEVVRAVDRYGWYVDRKAFGFDLYERGSEAVFRSEQGGELPAGAYLKRAWRAALRPLRGLLSHPDRRVAAAFVDGNAQLPLHGDLPRGPPPVVPHALPSVLGRVLDPIFRPSFSMVAVVAIWAFTVFRVDGSRQAYITVPRAELPGFLQLAQGGELDRTLTQYLDTSPRGIVLETYYQGLQRGIFDAMGPPERLAPPERERDGVPRLAGGPARRGWQRG